MVSTGQGESRRGRFSCDAWCHGIVSHLVHRRCVQWEMIPRGAGLSVILLHMGSFLVAQESSPNHRRNSVSGHLCGLRRSKFPDRCSYPVLIDYFLQTKQPMPSTDVTSASLYIFDRRSRRLSSVSNGGVKNPLGT